MSTIVGRWGLAGTTFTVALPFPGCPSKAASYTVDVSALRGLLELSPGDESCTARAIVLTGHWALAGR